MARVSRGWFSALAAGLLVTLIAAAALPALEVGVELCDLLPDDEPAAEDYRAFVEAFGAFEKVWLLVTLDDPAGARPGDERLIEGASLLAERLAASPLVSDARSGFDEVDERFFLEQVLPRAVLFVPQERLAELGERLEPRRIRERVARARVALGGPLGEAEAALFVADPLGAAPLAGLAPAGEAGLPVDPLSGAFLSPDGRTALVMATPAVRELDAAAGEALLQLLRETELAVEAELGTGLGIDAVGGPLYAAHDARIIRGDLLRTLGGSAVVIALMLWLHFGRLGLPLALVLTVVAGVVWTAGALAATRGSISVVGISFAAILVGLGVDYGIHGASAFEQARRAGCLAGPAMRHTFRRIGPAVLASAATTAGAFAVLFVSRIDALRELGLIVAAGVVLVLGATVSLGAPLLVLATATRAPAGVPGPLGRVAARAVGATVALARRRRAVLAAVLVAVTALALWGIRHVELDVDLRSMRPANHPSARAEIALAELFGQGVDRFHAVVPGAGLDEALARAREVRRLLADGLGAGLTVHGPDLYLAERSGATERVPPGLAGRAARELRAALVESGFRVERFARPLAVLDALAAGRAPERIDAALWPEWFDAQVARDGETVRVLLTVAGPGGSWPAGPPAELVERVRRVAPGVGVASVALVGAGLRDLVGAELERLAGWALAVVAGLVVLSFRGRVDRALMALAPVAVGSVWLVGLCGVAGVPITLFSVAAAPLLLGIGIDDGLHAVHGIATEGGLARAVRHAGPAMVATSLTTAAGFGSLLASRLPALRAGGAVIALGTLLCLGLTLLLPALGRDEETAPDSRGIEVDRGAELRA